MGCYPFLRFLQGQPIHAGIGKGFDIPDTVVVILRCKATGLLPERERRLPLLLISPGLRGCGHSPGGQGHINVITQPHLNNLIIASRPGGNLQPVCHLFWRQSMLLLITLQVMEKRSVITITRLLNLLFIYGFGSLNQNGKQ